MISHIEKISRTAADPQSRDVKNCFCIVKIWFCTPGLLAAGLVGHIGGRLHFSVGSLHT
jgi:hypothetical protein